MRGNGSPQRSVTLPPLNLSRLESNISHRRNSNDIYNKQHDSETTIYFQRQAAITTAMKPSTSTASNNKARSDIIDASQTILFTSSTLQRTVGRCISYTGNDSLHASFSSTLYKSKTSTDKLVFILDSGGQLKIEDLIQSTSECIIILKELCFTLRTRLSILVQGLDAKFSRNLLVNLYTATVDIKSAWETIQPYLTIDPLTAISKSPGNRNRSHSEASPILSPLASPNTAGDNTQLYTHLRNAVTGSLHVLNTLVQSIEETKSNKTTKISASLERKLNELTRQAQNAIDLCNRLDKNVEANMGNNKDDLLLLPTRQESSRRIWEDTSIYLKAIVSVMTFIRSISTEEDFAWPKSIKQGCLYVTRMTAEVAKLWNTYSTFAEDGFYLGRQERSASISEQQQQLCTSPAGSLLTPPTTDIPMQRRNTQQ